MRSHASPTDEPRRSPCSASRPALTTRFKNGSANAMKVARVSSICGEGCDRAVSLALPLTPTMHACSFALLLLLPLLSTAISLVRTLPPSPSSHSLSLLSLPPCLSNNNNNVVMRLLASPWTDGLAVCAQRRGQLLLRVALCLPEYAEERVVRHALCPVRRGQRLHDPVQPASRTCTAFHSLPQFAAV